jgi:hypothetical protein
MSDSSIGRYRRAYPRIFRHPGFKALTPLGQRLTLYILFGPQSNRIGCFYFSLSVAAEDLGTTAETSRKALPEVLSAFGWVFDSTARVLYVPSWWRWNHPDHDKVLVGNLKDINEVPPCGLVDAFSSNLAYLRPELHETFARAIAGAMRRATPSQKQYQKQEKKQEQKPSALRAGSDGKALHGNSVPDERLVSIARKVLKEAPRESAMDYLVDVFQFEARAAKLPDIPREQAISALCSGGLAQ